MQAGTSLSVQIPSGRVPRRAQQGVSEGDANQGAQSSASTGAEGVNGTATLKSSRLKDLPLPAGTSVAANCEMRKPWVSNFQTGLAFGTIYVACGTDETGRTPRVECTTWTAGL